MVAAPKKGAQKPKGKSAKAAKPKPKALSEMQHASGAEFEAIVARYRGRPTKYDPAFCEAVVGWGSPDRARIVTASYDASARVCEAESGQALLTLQGHEKDVLSFVQPRWGTHRYSL